MKSCSKIAGETRRGFFFPLSVSLPVWNADNQWPCMFWFDENLSIKPAQDENWSPPPLHWWEQLCSQMWTNQFIFPLGNKLIEILMTKDINLGRAHLIIIYASSSCHCATSHIWPLPFFIFFDAAWCSTTSKCLSLRSTTQRTFLCGLEIFFGITSCLLSDKTGWSVFPKELLRQEHLSSSSFLADLSGCIDLSEKSHGGHGGCRVNRPLTASLYSSKSHNITNRILKAQSLLQTLSQDAKLARSFSSRHSDYEPEFCCRLCLCIWNRSDCSAPSTFNTRHLIWVRMKGIYL